MNSDGVFIILPEYQKQITPNTSVFLVDDVITTTLKTLTAMRRAVQEAGGSVLGAGVIWNRDELTWDIPLLACVSERLPVYSEDVCPLCRQGVAFNLEHKYSS